MLLKVLATWALWDVFFMTTLWTVLFTTACLLALAWFVHFSTRTQANVVLSCLYPGWQDGSALTSATIFIKISVDRAGLVLRAFASIDWVAFPEVFWWACTFFNALALAGVPIIEENRWFTVVAVELVLGTAKMIAAGNRLLNFQRWWPRYQFHSWGFWEGIC